MSVSSYLNQVLKQKTFDIIRHRGPEMSTSNIQVGDVIPQSKVDVQVGIDAQEDHVPWSNRFQRGVQCAGIGRRRPNDQS